MNLDEYQEFLALEAPPDPMIHVKDLLVTGPQTLVFGYTLERNTWHVYFKDGLIHLFVYCTKFPINSENVVIPRYHIAQEKWSVHNLIPDKRAYPGSTNFIFACQLRQRGGEINFTTWDQEHYDRAVKRGAFYGELFNDL